MGTAVVIGAAGAFGEAIVARLIRDGLAVVAVGRSFQALEALADRHPGLIACTADIADDKAIPRLRAALPAGPVRIAVHGPGLSAPGSVATVATDALAQAVNLKAGGLLRLARAIDHRLEAGSRLVAIAGHYGLEPAPHAAAPGVANAAVINLARQLSLALGPRGITAHVIAPGPADTERLWRIAALEAERRGTTAAEVIEGMRRESSTGTLTDPAEVAWAVSLLLAPEAGAMTGSTLMLDAGRRRGLP
ncbi:SDR family NAD(P)-dependent oxidoreductase [Zavarzinia compransoris]|uniref:Short-chain dehydrogenase n=1 Tax=Zavarzinia compransoris TaxID=1264899 RepID=A0A317EAI4_9PROT|nr:SDR family oxidoreductase [Zavarzinia compransoris]PWR23160.1 short-chain dehydrogenase [Zavarzinia compransoris]TDP46283.1 NADP-dependent 3-hydroxy acid dehydrogenase YdfG [Zavarzinia compransoris]